MAGCGGSKGTMLPQRKRSFAAAKRMPKAPSANERLLWRIVRERRLGRLKFRRQVPLWPYVADFACLRHRLLVETAGRFHDAEHDAPRGGG